MAAGSPAARLHTARATGADAGVGAALGRRDGRSRDRREGGRSAATSVQQATKRENEVMPEPDLVKTGIAGLDAILSDGIPRGNVVLLEGAIGTGKTTLGVEFVYRGRHVVRRARHHRALRGLARQARARRGAVRLGPSCAGAPGQTEDRLHDPAGVPAGAAARPTACCSRRPRRSARAASSSTAWRASSAASTARSLATRFTSWSQGLQRENLTAVLAVEASALDG